MKKLITTALVTGLLLGLGATAAQASVDHELRIEIPAVLMIRFVDGAGVAVADAATVAFEPTAAAIAAGNLEFGPASVDLNWADVEVFANTTDTNWQLLVATDNDDFEWSKVTVTPAGGLLTEAFSLPEGEASRIFASTTLAAPLGAVWTALGISPATYELTLDGFEDEGTYETTVTYTIADL